MSPRLTTLAVLAPLAACTVVTAPPDARGTTRSAVQEVRRSDAAPSPGCTFARGVTTCSTTTQTTETSTHAEVSGCRFGPSGLPGRRTRTFQDTFRVTATTTTLAHGRAGPVYSTTTTTSRELVGSTQLSDVCEAV